MWATLNSLAHFDNFEMEVRINTGGSQNVLLRCSKGIPN
jgi:hypothetical protein